MRNDASVVPMLMAAAGIGVLSVMDGFVKHLAAGFDLPQIVFMRYAAGALWAIPVFLAVRAPFPGLASLRANALRAAVTVVTAYLFFYGILVLPLADAVTLSFTAPLFMAAFGRLLLGEPVARSVLIAIALAFAGVLVILQGQLSFGARDGRALLGIAAALGSAITYALAMVLVRRQTAYDPVVTIVLLQNVLGALFAAPIALAAGLKALAGPDLVVLATIGLLGMGGHLFMTFAYKRAHAARLGVLEYTALLWLAIIGYVAFGEVPTIATLLGAVLIIGACLIAARPQKKDAALGPEAAT